MHPPPRTEPRNTDQCTTSRAAGENGEAESCGRRSRRTRSGSDSGSRTLGHKFEPGNEGKHSQDKTVFELLVVKKKAEEWRTNSERKRHDAIPVAMKYLSWLFSPHLHLRDAISQ